MVALNIGFIAQLGSIVICARGGGDAEDRPNRCGGTAAPGFAVEKETKISPEPSPDVPPTRPRPRVARLQSRSICVESSGAFVAMTMMIEPMSVRAGPYTEAKMLLWCRIWPTGTPAMRKSTGEPVLHCTKTPTV